MFCLPGGGEDVGNAKAVDHFRVAGLVRPAQVQLPGTARYRYRYTG